MLVIRGLIFGGLIFGGGAYIQVFTVSKNNYLKPHKI